MQPRLQLLILIKTDKAHSKQALATALGINANSAQNWKKRYEQGGLPLLLSDQRGGNNKPLIDALTDEAIVSKLSDPYDAPRSYKELQGWVDEHYIKGINYHTLNKHVKHKHGAKIKVARKSHVRKDEEGVSAFKKNR